MRRFNFAPQALGQLEQRLMELLWDSGEPLLVRDVLARLGRSKLAYTTVMTTLDRLYKKRLLTRAKQGNAFAYQRAIDRETYQRRIVTAAVAPLLEEAAGPVLAAFVDVAAKVDDRHLAELERLIAVHRSRR